MLSYHHTLPKYAKTSWSPQDLLILRTLVSTLLIHTHNKITTTRYRIRIWKFN
jgi:hypothetical protein